MTAGLVLLVLGRPAYSSCQSSKSHREYHLSAINEAHAALQATQGAATAEAWAIRYHALKTLAKADPDVLLAERTSAGQDDTGLEAQVIAELAGYAAEADTALIQWQVGHPEDPAAWRETISNNAPGTVRIRQHQHLEALRARHARMPDDLATVQALVGSLRGSGHHAEAWRVIQGYVDAHPDETEAYRVSLAGVGHPQDEAPRLRMVTRWVERFPHDLEALAAAIAEAKNTPRFQSVIEALPRTLNHVDGPVTRKASLCDALLQRDDFEHVGLECHIALAAKATRNEYGAARIRWDLFFDTTLALDRWDVAETLISTLPPGLRKSALIEAVGYVNLYDGHCGRALALLDNVDVTASHSDQDAMLLMSGISHCSYRGNAPESVTAGRSLAKAAFTGFADHQLVAVRSSELDDLLSAEIERRLAIDPANEALDLKRTQLAESPSGLGQ